ncbi:MAG: thioether cross-link-forming SCIFF peptide maturase [Oscillospiraceae bacterium]|nr:thioether cross-link-forming SCIFF peptide maturase [Oscillospiraceae bacterium]
MIHTFKNQGRYFCADTNSGAVHEFDALACALLENLNPSLAGECPASVTEKLTAQSFSSADISETYAELCALEQSGQLFAPDECGVLANSLRPAPLKSMCLNVAHDCNLRCAYCFASQGDFGAGRELMPLSVAEAAVDFLVAHSGKRRNLELDFFGGEPLMNWQVVVDTVTYARSIERAAGKEFRFTITTNGLLLDDNKIDFINREMANVVLSLDGRKAVHDCMRPTPNGRGSYDLVVPQYQKLVATRGGKEYYVRGTFTRKNLDFAEDVLHMAELGFHKLSMEPAVLEDTLPFALREDDLPAILAEYDRLTALLAKRRDIKFFHFMLDLRQGPCVLKRLRGCSCGNEYCAVTPSGELYPCHQFVGLKDWRMGSVLTGAWDAQKQAELVSAHLYNKPECRECWAKFYCGGGCNAANVLYQGTLFKPTPLSCALERKRVECAIALAAE